MDRTEKQADRLEAIYSQLLSVKDADSLILALSSIKDIPVAFSTIENVTDGTGLNMSLSVVCSKVRIEGRAMCLVSDDKFTVVELNLDTVKKVSSKITRNKQSVVMNLTLKNGAEFLLIFYTDFFH